MTPLTKPQRAILKTASTRRGWEIDPITEPLSQGAKILHRNTLACSGLITQTQHNRWVLTLKGYECSRQ